MTLPPTITTADPDDETFVSTADAAAYTGYTVDTINQMCRDGRIPARKLGHRWFIRRRNLKAAVDPLVLTSGVQSMSDSSATDAADGRLNPGGGAS